MSQALHSKLQNPIEMKSTKITMIFLGIKGGLTASVPDMQPQHSELTFACPVLETTPTRMHCNGLSIMDQAIQAHAAPAQS